MRIAASLTALALVALTIVGVYAETHETPADGENGSKAALEAAPVMNWTLAMLADEVFTLDSVNGASFDVVVPNGTLEVVVDVRLDEGAYSGQVSWTGLGDCDGTGGMSGPAAVNTGKDNGSGSGRCVLEAGTHTASLSVETGVTQGTFTVLAVVPA